MSEAGVSIAPVTGRARIDVLDVLRGLAILGIFYMNVPTQASSVTKLFADPRLVGWSPLDKWVWVAVDVFLEGTQRGVLELLFGAGFMVLTARAMRPDGPVAIADLFFRRTLWLLAFGLVNVFVVLWVGDILTVYAIASLFLFPFRLLGPKALVAIGSLFALTMGVMGTLDYVERVPMVARVERAQAAEAAGRPVAAADAKALGEWNEKIAKRQPTEKMAKDLVEERKAHAGGWLPYAQYMWTAWLTFMVGKGFLGMAIVEAFCMMLIGVALWKWGVTQGLRSARFYLGLMVVTYGLGLGARIVGVSEVLAFLPIPKTLWITEEAGRILTSIGHVAAVNLAMKSLGGMAVLKPFKAVGRMAFSVYFLEQIIGLHILFAPYGFDLWDRYGHAAQFAIGTAVIVLCTIVANLWARSFVNGPLEWAWRSLAYWQWQPFRHPRLREPLPGPTLVVA
ncbi:DUF418 domain-containing protein [Sphingomonas sp. Leaf25]|uniref:DUF418 domain-containing protein n=1 Tax=Sphingomonas sp. Leaf25 TaxID=1735692 RepID=UPI0006F287D0|nr:DUF418 domain-containing protein [Sphingomonas sp. Leaf25]KQM98033.1 hypothetical protein ASE78_07120 [Sphingomonas sp. Leaf25]